MNYRLWNNISQVKGCILGICTRFQMRKVCDMKKRLLLLSLIAVLAVFSFAVIGCGNGEEATTEAPETTTEAPAETTDVNPAVMNGIRGDGTLVVATDPSYPPFQSMQGGEVVGFDIDLVDEIASRMGATVEWTFLEWDGLLTALSTDSRDFDFAASAMTITEERAETILFSDPYFVSVQALAVPYDSDIESIDDVGEGFRVGVQNGTTGHMFSTDQLEPKGVTIRPYQGGQECFLAMQSGEVDGVVIDLPVAVNQAAEGGFDMRVIPLPAADTENFGFPMGQSRTEMAAAINEVLAEIIADGTYAEIYARWIDADNPPTMP